MTNTTDKFDVLRSIVEQLKKLPDEDKEKIIKWACEELGISEQSRVISAHPQEGQSPLPTLVQSVTTGSIDIKSFVAEKNPQTDIHFAVVVAYYYRFLAPEKKDSISSEDLQEAARLSGRARLSNPAKTTNNAVSSGLLDSAGRGIYKINTVGENLVVLVLPGDLKNSSVAKRKVVKKASVKTRPAIKKKK